jgi:tetratricopeptide (TPR) repeat protein
MDRSANRLASLFSDLRRRGVVQTVGVYLVAAWATIEVATTIFPYLGVPDSAGTALIVVLGLGIPVVAVLAWAFDLTPEGIRRADASAETEGHAGSGSIIARGRLPLALGLVIVLASVTGVVWIRFFGPPAPDLGAVAVFPFEVQGDAEAVGHLGEGMVTLLSRELDGVAGLRGTDPSTILNLAGAALDGLLDPATAREFAKDVGAARFVLGTVTEVAGQIALSARLYESDETVEPTTASVEGAFTAVFELAEDLVAQLLAQRVGAVSRQLASTAARDTESLAAFKAFVDAERWLRGNRRDSAIAGFQRAVEEDPTFALAYYRLAVAAGLRRNYRLVESSLERATAFAHRLSDRDRRALEAFTIVRAGRIDEGERLYVALLQDYPDAWESRYQLGDLLTEHNPPRGRPSTEGLPLLQQVVRVDPAFVCPTCTLANFALAEADIDRSDSISYARTGGPERFRVYAAASAAARADESDFARWYRPSFNFYWQGPWLAAWFESYDWAERLVRPMVGTDRRELIRVHGTFILTDLLVGQGRWGEVPGLLDRAAELAPGRARLRRAFYVIQPLADPSAEELDEAVEQIGAWNGTDQNDPDLESPLTALLPWGRAYLLGLLQARRGEPRQAIEWADSLGAIPGPDDAPWMAEDLALTIRAEVALREGRPADALADLEGVSGQIPVKVMDLASTGPARIEYADLFTQEHARLLRIEALRAMGRAEEARRWADNGFFRIGGNAVLAPTLRKIRGEVYDDLGDAPRAVEHYERFLKLWEGADPRLQSHSDGARGRLEALGPEVP